MVSKVMEKKSLLGLRIDAGFERQIDLAKAAGLTKSTVWLAENGKPISSKSAYKIIKALKERGLNVRIDELDWSLAD
jgi:DNA-binding XRE family transcriptional regulator